MLCGGALRFDISMPLNDCETRVSPFLAVYTDNGSDSQSWSVHWCAVVDALLVVSSLRAYWVVYALTPARCHERLRRARNVLAAAGTALPRITTTTKNDRGARAGFR